MGQVRCISQEKGKALFDRMGISSCYKATLKGKMRSAWGMRIKVFKRRRIKNRFRLGLIADCFNVINLNTATSYEIYSGRSGYIFQEVDGVLDPRILRLGIRIM